MTDSELKGLALQIAAQLPNDREIAMKVLRFAFDVVRWRAEQGDKPVRGVPGAEIYELHPSA
jgi:hypothetical protein